MTSFKINYKEYCDDPAIIADNGKYKLCYKEETIHMEGELPSIIRNEKYTTSEDTQVCDKPAIIECDNHKEWWKTS